MSDRYKGAILSPTAPTVTPQSAGGIYTSSQQLQYQGQGVWPQAVNNPINNSLRFRSSASARLNRTFATPTSRRIWTWSGWVKKSANGSYYGLFSCAMSSTGYATLRFNGDSADSLHFSEAPSGGGYNFYINSTAVYRDPSAWYHIVVAVDTTQATASNRIKMYVNGVQITAFSTATYPSQNFDTNFNSAVAHNIGSNVYTGTPEQFFDGYMAEINFIDGSALTPSSFGTTDAYGIWQPIPYTGAYGTNGFYLPFRLNSTSSYYGGFNGSSQYLTLPTSSAFSMGTGAFTVEAIFNCAAAASNNILLDQWQNASGSFTTGQWELQVYNNILTMYIATGASSNVQLTATVSSNIWYHVAVVRSGTTVTMYLNGTAVSTATVSGAFGLSAYALTIGRETRSTSGYFSGQLSNIRITNTAVYTANFTPPTSPLTAVSGTQLLTLQNATIIDNSTNAFSITNTGSVTTTATTDIFAQPTLTSDYSGNNNNWAANNISLTPGSTYDSMKDVPTNTNSNTANYPTLNPLSKSSSANVTGGNLNWSSSAYNYQGATSTTALPSSGKWYWETFITTGGTATSDDMGIGVQALSFGTAPKDNNTITDGAVILSRGDSASRLRVNNTSIQTGTSYSFTTNDIIQVAFDADSGKIWFGKNNSYFDASGGTTGNPASGTNPVGTLTAGSSYLPVWDGYTNTYVIAANFGQRPFSYTPPSGFYPLNTYNLPTPTILDGDQYMDATLYTGTNASLTITNSGSMQPDLTWVKARSQADQNVLCDSVRGATKRLYSNLTNAEDATGGLVSINSNGFTLGDASTSQSMNNSGITYVAWQWKANGSGVSNTQGTITSTVSANTTAGFSIFTYTGNGTAGATVGHGLGVAPNFIFIKCRSNSPTNWFVGGSNIASAGNGTWSSVMEGLNTTNAINTGATSVFNSTAPTSSLVTLGTEANANGSGRTFVMYCWAAVAGYSAFGSYTGNGSTDGPFIYTGFRPRFVLIKRTDSGNNWFILDTSRDTFNLANDQLLPNSSAAESTNTDCNIDILSNGFKLRTALDASNGSGGTYIYACFAENPFKISRAR